MFVAYATTRVPEGNIEGRYWIDMFRAQDHEMTPKHEVLTAKEKNEVLETLGIGKQQLPLIKETDPVAKDITAKPGDVLRIVRKSQTAGQTVYYRLVTAG